MSPFLLVLTSVSDRKAAEKMARGLVEKRIRELHPYDLPEIIAVPLVKGYQKYLDWIGREVQSW